jgi:hypothetical protein
MPRLGEWRASQQTTLADQVALLCGQYGAAAVAAEVEKYKARATVPMTFSRDPKETIDDAALMEMARRLEQETELTPWPVALDIAARAQYNIPGDDERIYTEWLYPQHDAYLNSRAKRFLRKFTEKYGRRFRSMYLFVVSSDRDAVRQIMAEHRKRIGKSRFYSEQDITDEYLNEVRSVVADDVRLDLERRRAFAQHVVLLPGRQIYFPPGTLIPSPAPRVHR